jgi:hypothetical protein
MSYEPGTRLSYNNGLDTAIVLTDGMVMATIFVGSVPSCHYMKIADWTVLATMQTPPPPTPEQPIKEEDPVYFSYYEDTKIKNIPAYTERYEGTKFKWILDKNNYRVAIQTKKGVLQVKSVTDGGGDVHTHCNCIPCWEYHSNAPWRPRLPLNKKFFANYEEWVKSLPPDGKITIE